MRLRSGLRPEPSWRAYSAPPGPLAGGVGARCFSPRVEFCRLSMKWQLCAWVWRRSGNEVILGTVGGSSRSGPWGPTLFSEQGPIQSKSGPVSKRNLTSPSAPKREVPHARQISGCLWSPIATNVDLWLLIVTCSSCCYHIFKALRRRQYDRKKIIRPT